MSDSAPYSDDERREMRRLLIASGNEVVGWSERLRRSAAWLTSLSPEQAGIVAEQANAIASDPHDYGDEDALEQMRVRIAEINESERGSWVWREIVAVRRRHYPAPDEGPGGTL